MKKVIIGTVLGGLVMFACGFVSWAALGVHNKLFHEMPGAAVGAMKQADLAEGVYLAPYVDMGDMTKEKEEAFVKAHEAGPRAFVIYHPDGATPMAPMTYAKGLGLTLAMSLVATLLLASAGIGSWFGRFLFVVGIGVLAGLGEGMYWNYFSFPDQWAVHMAIDHLAAWAVTGIFLAIVVKPEHA